MQTADALATWSMLFDPTPDDIALADRALLDTVAVAVAARHTPITAVTGSLSEAGRWAVAAHILDFDDLHVPTTTHISTICVPVALALGGGAREYLAGAGVMARLGWMLGWEHYAAGWHVTATTGVIAAAVVASSCLGLSAEQRGTAISLAVSSSSGVQRAFGSDAKSLQVGLAAQAGVQAARLAADGATANPLALEQWMDLVGGHDREHDREGDASGPIDLAGVVPGGLAIKLYPCCYALQRPIAAVRELRDRLDVRSIRHITVRTPAVAVVPLNQHNATTGLQGKFSLEYAVAAALLDDYPGLPTFTDAGVRRPEARALPAMLRLDLTDDPGTDLLTGTCRVEVEDASGLATATVTTPPGAPARPPTDVELAVKVAGCLDGTGIDASELTWDGAAGLLRRLLP